MHALFGQLLAPPFIAEEEACFCQFEAPSRDPWLRRYERAALAYALIHPVDLAASAGVAS